MYNHRQVASEVISELVETGFYSHIVLYGSVFKGCFNESSDIDIAPIVESSFSSFPCDNEGISFNVKENLESLASKYFKNTGIRLHLTPYTCGEFECGIELGSRCEKLLEVGELVYDFERDLD